MSNYKRYLWLGLGCVSLALGIVGAVLPILPTTPFVLLAAYCFANSSPKLHKWLTTHRHFGPLILDWEAHGAISNTSKTLAIVTMATVFAVTVWLSLPVAIIVVQAVALSGAAIFVLSRPSPPLRCQAEMTQNEKD